MTPDFHTKILHAVTERLAIARAALAAAGPFSSHPGPAPTAAHILANNPTTIIRHCERDLALLERHKPRPSICRHGAGYVHWPCDEIIELAAAYMIEETEPAK
jgi:hypothetical protein